MVPRGRRVAVLSALLITCSSVVAAASVALPAPAAVAATVTPPDLQMLVPVNNISIGNDPGTGHRQLQFTHITWDAGTGPFAIKPTYSAQTGVSTFVQDVYRTSTTPGQWVVDHKVPLAVNGIFDAPSDYRYPLTRFTLNDANGDGTPGAIIRVSPKTDYCITADTYVGGVPHTPNHTSPPQSNCTLPSGLLGFSVGWGDLYDQTDNGQPIDLTGVPDGTYVLQATVDPQHIFTESDATNDVVDTLLQITGSSVTVLAQTSPVTIPPTITLTSPAAGASLQGTVALSAAVAATAPATPASVQYFLDGEPLGAPVTSAPFNASWTVGLTALGAHQLSAQVTDSLGNIGTSPVDNVTIVRNTTGGVAIDASAKGKGIHVVTSGALSTTTAGDTLVAFASLDGPNGGTQSATVKGASLAWHLVTRANTQLGDAEIWTATAPARLVNAHVTSTPAVTGYAQLLTVIALKNAGGVGASTSASGPSGAPNVALTTQAAASLSLAVGEDWDRAAARTPGAGQSMLSQWVDTTHGDTFWVQGTTFGSTSAGQLVTLADTAPTNDQWNLAAVEVVPTAPPPPQAVLMNPANAQALSGEAPVAAVVRDAVPLRTVRFTVDGHDVAPPVTRTPYAIRLDTSKLSNGGHNVAVIATDVDGRVAIARHRVVVSNPAREMTCFVIQLATTSQGDAHAATRTFHTASAGERLLAFVHSAPGTANHETVRGAGLHWQRLRSTSSRTGDVAVWTAIAAHVLNAASVEATVDRGMVDVTAIAIEGTDDPGASIAASGSHAMNGLHLDTTEPTSLVFAIGTSDGTTLPTPPGWAVANAHKDAATGRAEWVEYTNQPTGASPQTVRLPQVAGATGGWAIAAVELPGDGA
jgi:hypothetical protein